jgi:hypothetical protein
MGCLQEFVVEGVVSDLLHVVPCAMFNGVLQGEDTALGLGFIAVFGLEL